MCSFATLVPTTLLASQIRFHQWWRSQAALQAAREGGDGGAEPLLSQSLGSAEVWCSVTGQRIEKDASQVGVPRYHCMDLFRVDRYTTLASDTLHMTLYPPHDDDTARPANSVAKALNRRGSRVDLPVGAIDAA